MTYNNPLHCYSEVPVSMSAVMTGPNVLVMLLVTAKVDLPSLVYEAVKGR